MLQDTKPAGIELTAASLPEGGPAAASGAATALIPIADAAPLANAALLRRQLQQECVAMSAYAFATGRPIPDEAADDLILLEADRAVPPSLADLSRLHAALAATVAPALPGSVSHVFHYAARAAFRHRLVPVPVARYMALIGLSFVVLFFGVGLFDQINPDNINRDIFTNSGIDQLLVVIFLLSAAGTGACFAILFDILKSVSALSFLPAFSGQYWVKLALGVIAGLMLAELVPVGGILGQPAAGDTALAAIEVETARKPLIAMVGGFSANILYAVLTRISEAVESLFAPPRSS